VHRIRACADLDQARNYALNDGAQFETRCWSRVTSRAVKAFGVADDLRGRVAMSSRSLWGNSVPCALGRWTDQRLWRKRISERARAPQ
jgi:hypothetical protein